MTYAESIGCYSTVTTPTVVLSGGSEVTATTSFIAADWDIKVVWESSDLNHFTPASAPLLSRDTETATPSRNDTDQPEPKAGALMTPGQIAGMSTGISIFVIAVFATGVYALWRRKRKRRWVSDASALIDDNLASSEKGSSPEQSEGSAQSQGQLNTQMREISSDGDSQDNSPSVQAALDGNGWQAHSAQDVTVGNGTRTY